MIFEFSAVVSEYKAWAHVSREVLVDEDFDDGIGCFVGCWEGFGPSCEVIYNCEYPLISTFREVTFYQIQGNFVERAVGDVGHGEWVALNFLFVSFAERAVFDVGLNILGHALPVILSFDEVVGTVVTLVAHFVMCFDKNSETVAFRYY